MDSSALTILGSNPKHTINAFSIYRQILFYICVCVEKSSKITKRGRVSPLLLKIPKENR